MVHVVYIGDEITQTGLRLAGVDARVVDAGATTDELRRAIDDGAELVLLSGALVDFIPAEELADRLAAAEPPLVIVPDVCARARLPDLTREVRGTLGIDA